MQALTTWTGIVAPLDRSNVDTDAIIPKQYLKSIKRTGFGVHLFDDWRYLDAGEPGIDVSQRRLNPDFVLNQTRYQNASVLLARANFGCGSSREHAPWALAEYGFRVILAPSFADIFFNNCFKNGILPIVLSEAIIEDLFQATLIQANFKLTIDLTQQKIISENGITLYTFDVEASRKHRLLNGLDDIGLSLQHADKITAFEKTYFAKFPWLV